VNDKNNKPIDVEAVLDTGTKPDWVSAVFLKSLGLKEEPLDAKNNTEYTDFNGKSFKATGKVNLLISNDNFPGASCRQLTFLVTKLSKFEILLGRKTIKKEQLLQRPPKDLSGEGVYAGYQKGPRKGPSSLQFLVILTNTDRRRKRSHSPPESRTGQAGSRGGQETS